MKKVALSCITLITCLVIFLIVGMSLNQHKINKAETENTIVVDSTVTETDSLVETINDSI